MISSAYCGGLWSSSTSSGKRQRNRAQVRVRDRLFGWVMRIKIVAILMEHAAASRNFERLKMVTEFVENDRKHMNGDTGMKRQER